MTTKLFVPTGDFKQIETAIKNSGIKFYPFKKVKNGYWVEIEPEEHPLIIYLMLKYDINTLREGII